MGNVVQRVVGSLLVLLGLALLVVGLWFASNLDSSGAATFTARPSSRGAVVLEPSLLNRVDQPVTVTATGRPGATVWMGLVAPSDANALLGGGQFETVSGVVVKDWTATTEAQGTGPTADFAAAQVWRDQVSAPESATILVSQDQAPETLVITSTPHGVDTVTVTFTKKSWFVQAVVGSLIGFFLLIAGFLLVWSARPSSRSRHQVEPAQEVRA